MAAGSDRSGGAETASAGSTSTGGLDAAVASTDPTEDDVKTLSLSLS
jgi:hypothetical protein